MAVMIDEEDKWEVFFCLDAWDFFYERLPAYCCHHVNETRPPSPQ